MICVHRKEGLLLLLLLLSVRLSEIYCLKITISGVIYFARSNDKLTFPQNNGRTIIIAPSKY